MKKLIYILKLTLLAIITGTIISIYQYIIHLILDISVYLVKQNIIVFLFTVLISLGIYFIINYFNKKNPGYYGSGVPQVEAYNEGIYNFNPYKMILFISINSLFAFFSNFLLGSEGSSVSIGTSIGMIQDKVLKEEKSNNHLLSGSSAFACAFVSPLAGICHLIEENKKILSIKLVLKGIYVILISFCISYLIYPHSLLPYYTSLFLPIKYYWILLLVILFTIAVSKLFMYLIIKVKDITKGKKIMEYLTPVLIVIFITISRYYSVMVGSGNKLLNSDLFSYSIFIIIVILLFRLFATALSISSNTSGGLVLPTIAVGAVASQIIIKAYSLINNDILNYSNIFIICGMCISYVIVTKCPITGLVLGLKCMQIKIIIIPLIISILVCYIFIRLYKYDNIYHKLLKRLKIKVEV